MDTLQLLSQSLRGAIVAPPGKKLFVADYSGIEARVLLWCARDEKGLEVFRKGECIYCDMASSPALFNRPITKKDKPERALGKVAILGLGYQMGAAKFVSTAWDLGKVVLPEDIYCTNCGKGSAHHRNEDHRFESEEDPDTTMTAVRVVKAYREKYRKTVQLWYDMETAAGEAVCSKGKTFECYPVIWKVEGRFLYCTLPSGRRLAYADPQIKVMRTSWGAAKNTLTYMAVNPKTKKWMRQSCYGGLLVENIVQAISRDIMAEAIKRLEATGIYFVILTVHDELIAEAHKYWGVLKEFEALIAEVPDWAPGLPIAVEGFAATRYRK